MSEKNEKGIAPAPKKQEQKVEVTCSQCGRVMKEKASWLEKILSRLEKKGEPFLCRGCLKQRPPKEEGESAEAPVNAEPKQAQPAASAEAPETSEAKGEGVEASNPEAEEAPAPEAEKPKAGPKESPAKEDSLESLLAQVSQARSQVAVLADEGAPLKPVAAPEELQAQWLQSDGVVRAAEKALSNFSAAADSARDLGTSLQAKAEELAKERSTADALEASAKALQREIAEAKVEVPQEQRELAKRAARAAREALAQVKAKEAALADRKQSAINRLFGSFRRAEEKVLALDKFVQESTDLCPEVEARIKDVRQRLLDALGSRREAGKGLGMRPLKLRKELQKSMPGAKSRAPAGKKKPAKKSSSKKGTMEAIASSHSPKANGTGVSGLRVVSSSLKPKAEVKAQPEAEEAKDVALRPAASLMGNFGVALVKAGFSGVDFPQSREGDEGKPEDPFLGEAEAIAAAQAAVMAEKKKKTRRGKRG